MADPAPPTAATSPRGSSGPRFNRDQQRRGHDPRFQENSNRGPRGGRGQGGRGRGRGQPRGSGNSQNGNPAARSHEMPGPPSAINPAEPLTEDALQVRDGVSGPTAPLQRVATAETEGEICFICASPIEHISIAPCNHQTCHICSLRLRALYKTRACAHCRTEGAFVIFTDDANKRFEDFKETDFVKSDENLGIKYEKDEIFEDTVLLLRYNCPADDCDVACLGWPDLHRHVKAKHAKVMCDLCTRNKKVFTHEHELFSYGELRRHERYGDDNPGSIDQSGFKGHPECGFCRQRFYGDDELYTHCREKHERCHICDRRNGGRNPQYYLNYQELEKHFADQHFVCLDAECQANKTNVFESEMDLKAHQLSSHPNGLSKDARRDARLVSLSGFDLRTPYQPQRRGGRERETRGNGRGRDPNAEPLPISSAQPIGRAELAYQRQMAIQSSQSVSTRNFGGQLTQTAAAPTPRPNPPTQAQPDVSSLPAVESLNISSNDPQTPQEVARAARHNALLARATSLLGTSPSPTKLSAFRTQISAYRSSTITASALIASIFTLFDPPSSQEGQLGILIRELADLYENDQKRLDLLGAWNDWRSIHEDYPSLPVGEGSASSIAINSSGRRVLRLKSSTAQSSRSAVSRQGSWGNALSPFTSTTSSGEAFPALGGKTSKKSATLAGAAAWGSSSTTASRIAPASGPSSSSSSSFSASLATQHANPPRTMGARANEEMFPSLPPAAAVKLPSALVAGLTRGSMRWDDRRSATPTTNAWAVAGSAPTPAQASTASNANGNSSFHDATTVLTDDGDVAAAGGGAKKGKGKKGKGQVLYHFG